MRKFQIHLFLYLVPLFLQVSCSKTQNPPPPSDPWGIQEPHIYLEDLATHFRISELDGVRRSKQLSTADVFVFSEGPTTYIRLQSTAECSTQTERGEINLLPPLKTDRLLPAQSYLYEFLPSEALVDSSGGVPATLVCSIRFSARHQNGSVHEFELNQFQVHSGTDGILVFDSNRKPGTSTPWTADDLSQTTVQLLSKESLALLCALKHGNIHYEQIKPDQSVVPLHYLKWPVNSANEPVACRVFAIRAGQSKRAMSPIFWYIPHAPKVMVTQIPSPHIDITESQPVLYRWRISNTSAQTIWLRNAGQFSLLGAYVKGVQGKKATIATVFKYPKKIGPLAEAEILLLPKKNLCAYPDGFMIGAATSPLKLEVVADPDSKNPFVLQTFDLTPAEGWRGFLKLKQVRKDKWDKLAAPAPKKVKFQQSMRCF